mgnify:CR=1 FL=1
MDAARREKKEHGTLAFPFQIYPALDGSEADDSDFIPYHWHPELEIITVDAGLCQPLQTPFRARAGHLQARHAEEEPDHPPHPAVPPSP